VSVGSEQTVLIVLRGNSASGKSAIARAVRERYGRGIAIVGQDNLRRVVLREHDKPGAPNVGLIGMVGRYALDAGYHVVVEGILYAAHYGDMLAGLCADHRGLTRCYYLDVPFEETLRRHQTKPPAEYGQAEMSDWWHFRINLCVNIVLTWPFTSHTCMRRVPWMRSCDGVADIAGLLSGEE
jgi:hypothetical protein